MSLLHTSSGAAVLAHAAAGHALMPLPLLLLVAMGGVAVVAKLIARQSPVTARLGEFSPPAPTMTAGYPFPAQIARMVGLVGAAALVMTAALGSPARAARAADIALSDLWAGIAVASLLLGPVWPFVNPLRLAATALLRFSGDPDDETVSPLPARLGWWPAAASLLAAAWVALVLPGRPAVLLGLLAVLLLVHLGGAAVFGTRWLDHGDPLEAYSAVIGAIAPVALGAESRARVVSPRRRLAGLSDIPGTAALTGVLVAWYATDAIVETETWHALILPAGTWGLSRTVLLLGCAALVGTLGARATGRHRLAPALLPIPAGWALGHHLVPLAPALGLAGFVAGHLVAVIAAHDRAALEYGVRAPAAQAAQLEFRALVVVLLVVGITLRFGGI